LHRKRFFFPYCHTCREPTLDVGCNDGHYSSGIHLYVGLDVAASCLRKFQGNRVRGMPQLLPFRNGMFDNLFVGEVLEHIRESIGQHHP
jgi:hypothetical protein